MLIDHIGANFFPQIAILRIIGRIAFPLFAYSVYDGCKYTKKKVKYFLLLLGLGVICAIGYYIYSGDILLNAVVIFALSLVRLTYSNYIQGRSTIKVTISFI